VTQITCILVFAKLQDIVRKNRRHSKHLQKITCILVFAKLQDIVRKNRRHSKHLQKITWKRGHRRNIYENNNIWNETHLDILTEVARKPEGRRNVPKDYFGLLDEFKTNLLRVRFSCDKFGCIDYCQHHCIIYA
jgi:hypothetical protein